MHNPPPHPKWVLVRDQVVDLGEGRSLHVHRTELTKPDLASFTLLVEVSGEAENVTRLLGNPELLRGTNLDCLYEETTVTAHLEIWTNHEFNLSSDRSIFQFVCSTIESAETGGDFFEFLLPFVDFGQGDHPTRIDFPNGGYWQPHDYLTFRIEGHEWVLRHLFEIDRMLCTATEVARSTGISDPSRLALLKPSHTLLQSPSSLDREEAEAIATRICWLLHLAFAQPIAWSEMRVRQEGEFHFLRRRSFAFPTKVAASRPLRNWIDGTIKIYLEGAYPEFQKAADWWPETLNWYSIATEHLALESTSMIFCMLFDRISTKLLKGHEFPKQIGEDLAEWLEHPENHEALAGQFGSIMKSRTSGWEDSRSTALVNTVKGWNDAPSYPKKIAIAFSLKGLKAPNSELLKKRHKLMHEGALNLQSREALNFLLDLNEQILAILFAMLNFRGKFFMMNRGEKRMTDFELPEKAAGFSSDGVGDFRSQLNARPVNRAWSSLWRRITRCCWVRKKRGRSRK